MAAGLIGLHAGMCYNDVANINQLDEEYGA